ncbi:ABC transporter substrate-binding protein [Rhodopila sp.]|uniref:ABC transporter substrate-binding protein n=1 Tax=Rhodopila sp. TaxID=2480087 RepID=UPI002BBDAD1F|nr:ABC transporter substrate-binding protein [Rhodopila sp.]HVZ10735.1 ABC transporter substrate-binding protein [Rhodopila sp.]
MTITKKRRPRRDWTRLSAVVGAAILLIAAVSTGALADEAPRRGGILRITHRDSPASMSIHEEGTISVNLPMMGVFNNLVIFDQHQRQNSLDDVVPELATKWAWSEDGKTLTFTVRHGVTWHDGKPFTAADVKCTMDLLQGKAKENLKLNFRKGWYANIQDVRVEGDDLVVFRLKEPQPALLALLASGFTPIYPCHVSPRDMRLAPIGTGPFKFVEYKANQGIKLTRNPTYWKPGLPYLDGIEYTIITSRSTAILGFTSGKFDMIFPYELTVPLVGDVQRQMPDAVCDISPMNVAANLLMNPVPPFDDIEVRRAVGMAIDRKAFVDVLTQGKGDVGTAMQPLPEGRWGMPAAMQATLVGYGGDLADRRAKVRSVMEAHGYGPDKRLKVKMASRNLPTYRDAAVLLIDQLKEIYIDAELEIVETALWVPKLVRRDYQLALSQVGNGVDDPDQNYFENYACGSRTYMDYCNKEVDALIAQQSRERDQEKRKLIAWEIDRRLTNDAVRPMLYYLRGGTCMRPEVKNMTIMVNSIFNGWRMEDVWLAR